MFKKHIAYSNTGYFSALMEDYLSEAAQTSPFYHHFPSIGNFEAQIIEKKKTFKHEQRKVLVDQLKKQYKDCPTSEKVIQNINSLREENTFTITTGHQLNLFTGPLYFLYKIFSVINLSEKLKKEYPRYHFVPVYWMATEDHDFEEIQYFNFKGKKISWNREASGAVGELSLEGMDKIFQLLKKEWGKSEHAQDLLSYFENAYLKHPNLAEATRCLANTLFQEYGLVIVDGNDTALKKQFIPYAEKELTDQVSHEQINVTTQKLEGLGFKKQVHPREINLFYLKEGLRERILRKDHKFLVQDTDLQFSERELLQELQLHPERFSPNALLRPLYQEVILPNLCYVGGGGELAYWFQLKAYFESVSVPFPMLLLRNSVLLVPQKTLHKLDKLSVPIEKLFGKVHELKSWYTKKISEIEIDFTSQREHLKQQFKDLYTLAEQTDASFLGAVAAQEKKQLNGLDHLEKRLLKAQKRKLHDEIERLTELQESLFPQGNLQERVHNFSEWYLDLGTDLLDTLKENLDPLNMEFTVLEVKTC